MIGRGTVLALGTSQLVCWGTSYYLVAVLGDPIGAELGWSRAVVHGGFSAALVVMALTSRLAGVLVDRHGGRPVMAAGSLLTALGLAALAGVQTTTAYFAAWVGLGLAMRLTLYDAAFATLARLGGRGAQRAMSQVTLLGGLASTVFWPIGHALEARVGWRGALVGYAGCALLTVPLHLALPRGRHVDVPRPGAVERRPLAETAQDRWIAGTLYALILTLVAFLNSAMSAHLIGLLAASGLTAPVAVWIGTLRGVGQSLSRLAEVLSGSRLSPFALNLLASALLPVCFVAGLLGGRVLLAAAAFAFLYGVGNGLSTIARGALPLVLFDPGAYGAVVGRLLVPSFVVSAIAPLAYALVIERAGARAAMGLSLAVALAALAAAGVLSGRFGRRSDPPPPPTPR